MNKKLKVLILGYSSLVRRKIIITFNKNKILFSVASISFKNNEKNSYNWYNSYSEGIKKSNADLVYISLPNAYHYYWAKKSLENGCHVIVDKPATMNFRQAKNLVNIAKKKKKLISEAIFFNYHNQFDEALKIIGGTNKIKYAHANFVIPYPKKGKFLISKKLGGGCLMDSGPYAASVARLISGGDRLEKLNKVFKKNSKGLIVSFSILCKFKKLIFSGFFSFGGEYTNNLSFFSKNKYVLINRVFSPPTDQSLQIVYKSNNVINKRKIKKNDYFNTYLKKVFKAVQSKKFEHFYKILLADSKFREQIKK